MSPEVIVVPRDSFNFSYSILPFDLLNKIHRQEPTESKPAISDPKSIHSQQTCVSAIVCGSRKVACAIGGTILVAAREGHNVFWSESVQIKVLTYYFE